MGALHSFRYVTTNVPITYTGGSYSNVTSKNISCRVGDILVVANTRDSSAVVYFNGVNIVNGSIPGLIRRQTLSGNENICVMVKATVTTYTISSSTKIGGAWEVFKV